MNQLGRLPFQCILHLPSYMYPQAGDRYRVGKLIIQGSHNGVSFPMVSGIGVPPVEDAPKPPPYPPPESPRETTESPGSLAALGVLRTPMPAVSFADSIALPERAKTGSGDTGVGVSRVPSLDRVEEPSGLGGDSCKGI